MDEEKNGQEPDNEPAPATPDIIEEAERQEPPPAAQDIMEFAEEPPEASPDIMTKMIIQADSEKLVEEKEKEEEG